MTGPLCQNCLAVAHPVGAQLYEAAVHCILCSACYTVCEGAQQGCSGPPAMTSSCDVGTPSMPGGGDCGGGQGNTGCIACSENPGGPCFAAVQACESNPDCAAYVNGLSACPPGG